MNMKPVIIVHGGAWAIPDRLATASVDGVKAAARRAIAVLSTGGTAVDSVEAAVSLMEDNPVFNAGTGSVLNSKAEVEMDAMIMEGQQLKAGSVVCVQNIRNPVQLCRMVMEKTEHTMLAGMGANDFATEIGMPQVPPEDLITDEAREDFERMCKYKKTIKTSFSPRDTLGHDTVGAAALDQHGHVACAVSTGGITAQRAGRVGDSPIIGSGGYADDDVGAAAATGHGEAISKVCLTFATTDLIKHGRSPQEAAEQALAHMFNRVKGTGGVVVVDKDGRVGHSCTTERMAWAWAADDILHYGLEPHDDLQEGLKSGANDGL